jgi:hypothetical protein
MTVGEKGWRSAKKKRLRPLGLQAPFGKPVKA